MGDINGDGELDIAAGNNVANPSSPTGTVTVPYGNGSGAFTVGNVIAVNYGLGIAVADINKDTHLDIVEDSWNGLWVAAGPHTVGLDRDAGLATGIYFYRIEAEGSRKSGRIVVLDQ